MHDVMIDHVITKVGVAMVNLHIGLRDTTGGQGMPNHHRNVW